ncbi:uncharacterized protein VTP21DRAFT_1719 [Calcarisporiella thermophila]|uniref:uncharacterized protein n=1 Tax=Calcarisporiella thermophila TaxID=911321 RepID=UPI003743ADEE
MAEYKGGNKEGARQQALEKAREKMLEEFERQRQKIAKDNQVQIGSEKFISQTNDFEDELKQSTYGLVDLEDFRKIRGDIEEARRREAAKTLLRKEDKIAKKKKKKREKATLSFDMDGEGQEEESIANNEEIDGDSPEPAKKRSKFGKDPSVDTSFLPDHERDEIERMEREKLRQEWIQKQEEMKKEKIVITYSYWDGSGHRKQVECVKGDTIAHFLERCRQQFSELRGVHVDNLLYVKEDLIIPHHYTFYDFIINKARGKSGPLFNFDVHEDIRLTHDATVEKDESHAGKVVERAWYEKNKHIFPASRWEVYDPKKDYGSYTIKDKKPL